MNKPSWKCAVWFDEDEGGWYWDDSEDHGGFDRVAPNGAFQTRAAAENDARESFDMDVVFVDGKPDHYADDDSSADTVGWYLDGTGYRVEVFDKGGRLIEEYRAGDHPLDSQAIAPKGYKVRRSTLRKWALQTARETAEKYSPLPRVFHDADNESEYLNSRDDN